MAVARRLCLFEWVMLAYAAFTLLLMLLWWPQLVSPWTMVGWRVGAVALTVALWLVYRRWPNRWTMMLRVAGQMAMLSQWYPDTYEFNRLLPNLDHLFAQWEQSVFGCQPALLFSQHFTSAWLSEPLCLGYVSYYPMMAAVALWYFFQRYDRFAYCAFVILGSFFLFYVVFIFLPVAGPQFYYEAVGTGQIAQGVFPNVGHHFLTHQDMLPIPGADGGWMRFLVQVAHDAGERPTAAFPSSHVGVSVVLIWLAWEARSVRLFVPVAVLSVLMFFATFYIQAHYAIDAIAGLFAGTALYWLLRWSHGKMISHNKIA